MSRLLFNSDDVRRVIEHSINAPKQGKWHDGVPAMASVLLVHDDGVYLMSNGEPRDIVDTKVGRNFVAHAEGCSPTKDADWYETSRALVGGDDFGDILPWAQDMKAILDAGKQVCIRVTDNALELESADGK